MSLIPDGGETPTQDNPETQESQTADTTTEGGDTTTTETSFLFADGVGGEGDIPEWFKADKYKTVSAQAEAYTELESKFGSFTGAPKDGNYEIEGVDFAENPLMGVVAKWGAENQLSNDGLAGLVEKVNELANAQVADDVARAKEALGERADQRLQDLAQWGKNNLAPEEYEQFQGLAQTAGQVEVLEKLIGMSKNSKLVNTDTTTTKTSEDTEAELQELQLATNDKGQRLMEVDPDYRKKVNAKMKEFYK